jgi:hypothetical protein
LKGIAGFFKAGLCERMILLAQTIVNHHRGVSLVNVKAFAEKILSNKACLGEEPKCNLLTVIAE